MKGSHPVEDHFHQRVLVLSKQEVDENGSEKQIC
jgi:hypothetical protein